MQILCKKNRWSFKHEETLSFKGKARRDFYCVIKLLNLNRNKEKENNIKLTSEADENTSGLASLMVTDPDGNVILIDQHR